jgi:hypothetical protein
MIAPVYFTAKQAQNQLKAFDHSKGVIRHGLEIALDLQTRDCPPMADDLNDEMKAIMQRARDALMTQVYTVERGLTILEGVRR